jgi:hypothetical protein
VNERRSLLILLVFLALGAGLLTWGVVGTSQQKCQWAFIGTDKHGYVEVPCGTGLTSLSGRQQAKCVTLGSHGLTSAEIKDMHLPKDDELLALLCAADGG